MHCGGGGGGYRSLQKEESIVNMLIFHSVQYIADKSNLNRNILSNIVCFNIKYVCFVLNGLCC